MSDLNQRMREQEDRIGRLNGEAANLRTRLSANDPANTTLPPGEEPAINQFGMTRAINDAQRNFGDKLQALEGEKISLMKRLNMVLSELEKATHDKSDIAQKLREQERMAEGLKRKLDEVSSLRNVVNKNLQDDLKYERNLNEKLRDEMSRFENEKETLLSKLREEEELGAEIAQETNIINSNLCRKTDDLRRLENEHEINSRRLRELNEQLEILRMHEVKTRQEKILMDEQLTELTAQRNDLIRKMNELSDKYENYVNTMNRERQDITRANKNHIRILVTKLLVQIMDENLRKKRKRAFAEIYSTARQMTNLEYKLNRMQKILTNYAKDRLSRNLHKWYRNALDCVHEGGKRNALIDGNVSHSAKTKFFYLWRSAFLNRRKNFGDKMQALKIVKRVTHRKQENTTRNYMCRWRDFVERRHAQMDFLKQINLRQTQRNLRSAYVTWLSYCKKENLINRYDALSQIVTETWFKQRCFLALKHAVQQSKSETSHFKFTAWKNWCDTARKNKYHEKKEALVDKIQALRMERLMKKCYDAMKFGNVQHKFEVTRDLLEAKIPEREELEYRKACLIKNAATRCKLNVLRQCYLRHCDVMHRAMLIWKNACSYHNHIMNRMKQRLVDTHHKRQRQALMKWKVWTDKQNHNKLLKITEDCQNQNQNAINELNRNNEILAGQKEAAKRQQMAKLVRLRNMFNRKAERIFYDKWVASALYKCHLEQAVFKTARTCHKRRLRTAFNKYRSQVNAEKRREYIEKKCEWFENNRAKTYKKDCWHSWIQYIRMYKLGKKFLNRANNGIERNLKCDAFNSWKDTLAKANQQQFTDDINELKRRCNDQQAQLGTVKEQIEQDANQKMHTISKMKDLGHKIMANFITRMTHMQVARGFYTWMDTTKNFNKKRRMVRKAIVYWKKIHLQRGFRRWADNAYSLKEQELRDLLEAKQRERREALNMGNQQAREAANEEEELQQALKEATNMRDSLHSQFKNAFNTHVGRVQGNTYIEKRRNIFCTWRDFVKREKNAVNVIGAIARRTLRTEVWQRIRLVARENQLDANAEKVCTNLFKVMNKATLQRAFSDWRLRSYKQVCVQLDKTLEARDKQMYGMQEDMVQITKSKHERAERVLGTVRLRDVNLAFKEMTKYLKLLRVKQDVLRQNLNYMRIKRGVQKWHQRTQITHYLRRRSEQVCDDYRKIQMRTIWSAWRKMNRDEKRDLKTISMVFERMRYYDRAAAFQKWQQYTISAIQREKESKEHGSRQIGSILDRLVKRRLALFLHNLKLRGAKKEFKEKYLRRMINHQATYRTRHYFDRWRHICKLEEIAHTVNTEGEVVMKRNEAARHAKAMKEFLLNSGYDNNQIESYLDTKAEVQKSNMQKGVIGLFFQHSEFQVVPKAFNQWREYIMMRKRVKWAAKMILNRLYRPRLTTSFYRWKYDMADKQKKLLDLSKDQLIEKIIADENLIGATKSRLNRLDDAIDHLAIQRENLLGHFIRGQKLACTLIKNNQLKSMFRAFLRWKRWNNEYENMRLIEQLDRTNQMITDLSQHVAKLEGINKNLLVENEELRQAALDGIEIAKVVQELTKEREALSADLQDRAGTIKKLIEDNNNLSVRLSIAQKEAQQLDMINQSVYMQPAERDQHYR